MLSMEVQWVKYIFMVQWDDNNICLKQIHLKWKGKSI